MHKEPHSFFGDSFSLPETEEKVLSFWKEHEVFKKTLENRKDSKRFVFYEGPPGANGKPGIHHVLSRVMKDVVLRYKTMSGFSVPRRAGWDTHGLPVEIAAEKELGIKNKKGIEEYGVAAFNKKCRDLVFQYKSEWEAMTDRIGFWLDTENGYSTMEVDYMESLWWVLKEFDNNGHLYQGHRVLPWCTRCGTGLSTAEVSLGYKNVKDISVTVLFPLSKKQKAGKVELDTDVSLAAWTTTPWTLPGNVALAVGPSLTYKLVEHDGKKIIVAAELVHSVFGDDPVKELEVFSGKDLVGLHYTPPFEVASLESDHSFRVYPADFVAATDGTGIVHTAVMYGEDDYNLGKEIGLPTVHTVDVTGHFTNAVTDLAGKYVKELDTDIAILKLLTKKGVLLKKEKYAHDYPFCWRCSTPLLYYARNSWFVGVSQFKDKLVSENKTVNWTPEHTGEGRFGEWLRNARDWNISRERYWGTPLPIWECDSCDNTEVVGSLDELSSRKVSSGNRYFVMRHGRSTHNDLNQLDSEDTSELTDKGREMVKKAAEKLKKEKIDFIIASPFTRTRQTAHLIADILKVPMVAYDERLREINLGTLSGQPHSELAVYEAQYADLDPVDIRFPGGESNRDVRRRSWHWIKEFDASHKDRNVLVIGHGGPLRSLARVAEGWTTSRGALQSLKEHHLSEAEYQEITYRQLPRNKDGQVDLHRPFVDDYTFNCKDCDMKMHRVKETADVWFDSGAMPFAQDHYPFAGKELVDGGKGVPANYPADFIAEGVDQTRGWFYTLLATATGLGRKVPYKNVISLGLVNDAEGKKMSKSKGNTVEPWSVIHKHGIDAIRWFFYTASEPGDSKNFDEEEIGKTLRRVHMIVYNTHAFLVLYGKKTTRSKAKRSVMDEWILARRDEVVCNATKALEAYDLRSATQEIELLLNDLSRWYLRLSRKRLQKPSSMADYRACKETLHEVLLTLSQLFAPFSPFFAEALFQELRGTKDSASVHLLDWPQAEGKSQGMLMKHMQTVRDLTAAGLALRAQAGMRVRQPLARATIKTTSLEKDPELVALLAQELNVKEVVVNAKEESEITLDVELTEALQIEGAAREITRTVQGLRSDLGLDPDDEISLYVVGASDGLKKHFDAIAEDVGATEVLEKQLKSIKTEKKLTVLDSELWIGIKKS